MASSLLCRTRILLLEDDYLQAIEAEHVLRQSGAVVLGPYADLHAALASINGMQLHCALIDINLGRGPCFNGARYMLSQHIPVVFLTGYNRDDLPDDLKSLPLLEKPCTASRLVDAVAEAISAHLPKSKPRERVLIQKATRLDHRRKFRARALQTRAEGLSR